MRDYKGQGKGKEEDEWCRKGEQTVDRLMKKIG